MRRGTQSAVFFGYLLFLIRQQQKQSMRKVAQKIGCPSATVSQIEKGERALKEPKLEAWAYALSVRETDLEDLWWLAQGWVREDNGVRVFYTDYVDFQYRIMLIMRRYVCEPPIEVPQIESPQKITRQHRQSATPKSLESLLKSMSAAERNQVRGYIDAIIERR